MKHLLRNFLIISILFSTISSFAQTEKGSWMVGGYVGVNTGGNSGFNSFYLNLRPQAGYFLMKNLAVGAGVNFYYENSTTDYSTNTNSSYNYDKYNNVTFGISPFVRYYFGESILKPFVQAQYFYSHYNETTTTKTVETPASGYVASALFGAGLAYFVATNVSLDATLDYQFFQSNTNGLNYSKPAFQVGFQVFLPKK